MNTLIISSVLSTPHLLPQSLVFGQLLQRGHGSQISVETTEIFLFLFFLSSSNSTFRKLTLEDDRPFPRLLLTRTTFREQSRTQPPDGQNVFPSKRRSSQFMVPGSHPPGAYIYLLIHRYLSCFP